MVGLIVLFLKMNKFGDDEIWSPLHTVLLIMIVIVALILAAVIGSYVFALGAFLFKVMLGLVAIIIFIVGILIGRFFPYKNKEREP